MRRDERNPRPDVEGPAGRMPSTELGSYREAREGSLNPLAVCSWCHNHLNGEPPPDPEMCRIPAPDIKVRSRPRPDYQTAEGEPVAKDPHGRKGVPYQDTRHEYPEYGKIKLRGLKQRLAGGGRQSGTGRKTWNRIGKTLREDPWAAVREAQQMMRVPREFLMAAKKPLPEAATDLLDELVADERFESLVRSGLSVTVAAERAYGYMARQTAYDRLERLERSGGAAALFRVRAEELFRRRKITCGNRIEDTADARRFFEALAGGRDRIDELQHECVKIRRARVAITRYYRAGDMAIVQCILFLAGCGRIGG